MFSDYCLQMFVNLNKNRTKNRYDISYLFQHCVLVSVPASVALPSDCLSACNRSPLKCDGSTRLLVPENSALAYRLCIIICTYMLMLFPLSHVILSHTHTRRNSYLFLNKSIAAAAADHSGVTM